MALNIAAARKGSEWRIETYGRCLAVYLRIYISRDVVALRLDCLQRLVKRTEVYAL